MEQAEKAARVDHFDRQRNQGAQADQGRCLGSVGVVGRIAHFVLGDQVRAGGEACPGHYLVLEIVSADSSLAILKLIIELHSIYEII